MCSYIALVLLIYPPIMRENAVAEVSVAPGLAVQVGPGVWSAGRWLRERKMAHRPNADRRGGVLLAASISLSAGAQQERRSGQIAR
jgi:hypothetical protein